MAAYGCHVFSFDPTIGQSDHNRSSGVKFFNIGLSSFDQEGSGRISKKIPKSHWKTRTLASVINELGHEKVGSIPICVDLFDRRLPINQT